MSISCPLTYSLDRPPSGGSQVIFARCNGCVQVSFVYLHGGAVDKSLVSPHSKNGLSSSFAVARCSTVTGLISGHRRCIAIGGRYRFVKFVRDVALTRNTSPLDVAPSHVPVNFLSSFEENVPLSRS